MNSRSSLILSVSAILALVFLAAAREIQSGPEAAQAQCPPMHCQMIRAGEIEAIIGDGAGHRTRPGIWAMSSINHQFSIMKNMSSGMLAGEFRGKANTVLEYIDDSTSAIKREPTPDYPTRARLVFRARGPYYLDTELTLSDTQDRLKGVPWDFRAVAVNCYVNSPDDLRAHFLAGGEWTAFIPEKHAGPGTDIAPSYLKDSELEVWPKVDDPPFNWYKRNEKRFDEPFYYGRFGKMVLVLVFDQPRWIRFYLSPEGGGESLIPGMTSPAWDFEWIIPRKDYQTNREYLFRTCLVYKQYVSDEDVLREVRKVQADLGYETVAQLKGN